VRSFHDRDLEEISFKLLNGSHYQGLGGIEFKKDTRDGRYKLIEFNARFGMWDALGIKCGIDIPYIAYCDALGWPIEAKHDYREGVLWVDLQRDMRAFLIYHRQRQLTFGGWLRSLRGEKDWAFYSRDDWKPALLLIAKLFNRPWSAVRRRLPL
jgi:predicted ATP-grasp superfamily ATP-dependent carboligase